MEEAIAELVDEMKMENSAKHGIMGKFMAFEIKVWLNSHFSNFSKGDRRNDSFSKRQDSRPRNFNRSRRYDSDNNFATIEEGDEYNTGTKAWGKSAWGGQDNSGGDPWASQEKSNDPSQNKSSDPWSNQDKSNDPWGSDNKDKSNDIWGNDNKGKSSDPWGNNSNKDKSSDPWKNQEKQSDSFGTSENQQKDWTSNDWDGKADKSGSANWDDSNGNSKGFDSGFSPDNNDGKYSSKRTDRPEVTEEGMYICILH